MTAAERARDAFQAGITEADARELVYEAERALQQRREDRRPTGRGRHNLRCKGCYAFVRSLNARCARCSWDPILGGYPG